VSKKFTPYFSFVVEAGRVRDRDNFFDGKRHKKKERKIKRKKEIKVES